MTLPEALPTFEDTRRRLPEPEMIKVRPGLRLETLHAPGDSPALVFIHGGLGNLWDAYPQLVHFYGKQEIVSYSLAGNGASDDREQHTLTGHMNDLADLLDTLEIDAPILIGWSYGTEVALEYAKCHPVSALLLTSGGAVGLTPAWELPILKLVTALRLYRLLPAKGPLKLLAKQTMAHPDTPDRVIDEVLKANPLPRRHSAWRTVLDAFWGYDGREGLAKIDVPVLVVHGPADGVVPIEHARTTADLLPNAVFVKLAQTGHLTMLERPAAFARLLDRLVEAVRHPDRWPENVERIVLRAAS